MITSHVMKDHIYEFQSQTGIFLKKTISLAVLGLSLGPWDL